MVTTTTTTTTTTTAASRRWLAGALAAGATLLLATERAEAQEILLTGPLAGAPAVRKLRLYREKRFEVAPAVSFTLLDEYQRTILLGARINYNFTDWLALGIWGAHGTIKISTSLTDETQKVNADRKANQVPTSTDNRLTGENMGQDFKKQLAGYDWIAAPQVTVVPFRGKIAVFQSIYVDSDLYFFLGPAFIGLSERKDCKTDCRDQATFAKASRVAIAPTFGLGFTFYVNKWNAIGFEYRGLPFSWNTSGFDNHGADPDGRFPDHAIDDKDREFKFNQMLTLSYNFYFPRQYRVSE